MLGLSASTWAVLGVILGVAGLLLLFRYGMPFRVRSDGRDMVYVKSTDPHEEGLDRRYNNLGYLGLGLTIAGAACQIVAAYAPA